MRESEKVISFIEEFCRVPEGKLVGAPIKLAPFQLDFIREIYDNPAITRTAILSTARKNAKSATSSCLALAHLVGPMARENSMLAVGAQSRQQASIIFDHCKKMIEQDPRLQEVTRVVPSRKTIYGIPMGTELRILANVGANTHGLSPSWVLADECGQNKGPTPSPFLEALLSGSGAHENPLTILISTQAPSDADWFSTLIDSQQTNPDPKTVCHVHCAPADSDILDESAWQAANPALDLFRDRTDLAEQLKQAAKLPALEASARNLLLNQRVSLTQLFLAPSVVKNCGGKPDLDAMRRNGVYLGIDLSFRSDLTACVAASVDEDGVVHIVPWTFSPKVGMEERQRQSKAPYVQWVNEGHLTAVEGTSIDYQWVAEWLRKTVDECGFEVKGIGFDRWRIDLFKRACEDADAFLDVEWRSIGQGFKDQSPVLEAVEHLFLEGKLRHGMAPTFLMGCANAIAVQDPAGGRKLDKSQASQKIDVLVAAAMAIFMATEGNQDESDLGIMIG